MKFNSFKRRRALQTPKLHSSFIRFPVCAYMHTYIPFSSRCLLYLLYSSEVHIHKDGLLRLNVHIYILMELSRTGFTYLTFKKMCILN